MDLGPFLQGLGWNKKLHLQSFSHSMSSKLIFWRGSGIIEILFPGLRSNNFFYKVFTKGLEIDFQNRKLNYPNRIWNCLSYFHVSNKKNLLQSSPHLFQKVQNWFSKQEREIYKLEMELSIIFPGLWSMTDDSGTTRRKSHPTKRPRNTLDQATFF